MQFANQSFLASSRKEAVKTIWPHEYPIAAGTVLYRFIDTSKRSALHSPWWFEFEHFQQIRHFSLRHNYSLGYTARLFAAILYEWSEVNAVARARTTVPLMAWKGRGKQIVVGEHRPLYKPELDARDVNRTQTVRLTERAPAIVSKMTPMQGMNEVYQLYIPGLEASHRMYWSYFERPKVEPIATG